ncbi:MAG: hypothetical protein H6510_04375 [Acidobacteria bacterium]|nr:hypothetical protein [Acidobacteriota bacterium]MCB9397033.1 hypothetical protein [Acidobacteriota bacterium]
MRWPLAFLLFLSACFPAAVRPIPVRSIGQGSVPLYFLPGRYSRAADFVKQGFELPNGQDGVSVVFIDAHMGYYRQKVVMDALEEVIGDTHPSIKVGGISLGGFGAVMYARRHADQVRELVLFSPFLGDKAFLDRVKVGDDVRDSDSELGKELFACWAFLKETKIPVRLYCGEQDDFAPLLHFLETEAPNIKVHWLPGGHDWPTWKIMWLNYFSQTP